MVRVPFRILERSTSIWEIPAARRAKLLLLHVTGSNKATRKLVEKATWWYAEKLMGKRLISNLEITIKLKKSWSKDNEGEAFWDDAENYRPREFSIFLNKDVKIRNLLITLAHEMVHVKQWARGEMYEYAAKDMVRFHKKKFNIKDINYYDYPWEIEAFGRQLGLFVRFCDSAGIGDREDMQEEA
jgi:hypothetical protein